MKLNELIARRLNKFTVIATVLEVLHGHIEALQAKKPFDGLTAQEIEVQFNKRAKALGMLWFFPSYLQRHTKSGDFFVETNGRFRLRDELVAGVTLDELKSLRASIIENWETHQGAKEVLLQEFAGASALPEEEIEKRREIIEKHLADRTSQIFEIMSFAILHVYFRSLGFSLRRFSTTFANDGGMDFICGEGIYQVTAAPSRIKIERDLAKLPGTKRVIVAPALTDSTRGYAHTNENVLEIVEGQDLSKHFLTWLLQKDQTRNSAHHLQRVLEVAISELKRD